MPCAVREFDSRIAPVELFGPRWDKKLFKTEIIAYSFVQKTSFPCRHCGEFFEEELPEFVDIHAGVAGDEHGRLFRAEEALPGCLIRMSYRLLAFVGLGHHGKHLNALSLDVCDQINVQSLWREP